LFPECKLSPFISCGFDGIEDRGLNRVVDNRSIKTAFNTDRVFILLSR
jgi:hypothetical protein